MKKELLTYKDPKSPVSETFRTLRTNIQFMNTDRKLKTLLVTSTFPGEGKSWITSNLAVTFAQAGKKVILVDADMRKGRQYNIFGVLPKPGLSNYLSNMGIDDMENSEDVNIANYIQETDVENLHILTAGNVPPNPSELLVSRRMKQLLQELKTMCDLVIIDGTPCDLVTDAIILSRIVDSTIIITAQKETKKENLTRIVKNIQNVGGRIAGVVVNKVDVSAKKYNQAYYYGSISGANLPAKQSKKDKKKMDAFYANMFKNEDKELEPEEVKKQTITEFEEKTIEEAKDNIVSNEYNYETNTMKETVEDAVTLNEVTPNIDIDEDVKKIISKLKMEEPKSDIEKNQDTQVIEDMPKTFENEEKSYYDEVNDYNKANISDEESFNEENLNSFVEPQVDFKYNNKYNNSKKKNRNKFKNKKRNNNYINDFNQKYSDDASDEKTPVHNETLNSKGYQEVEAHVQEEGKISEIKIDQNMDEKTKEILRQVNEYIETEKRRQGEKH